MSNKALADMMDLLEQGYGGTFLVQRYTRKIDALITEIFNSVDTHARISLIATGGYGRVELAPFSDIDIMFFVPDRVHTHTAERLLYRLWDSGLTISHSFRTADECIHEANKDIRTRTSLLEARYVAGDRRLYKLFKEKVYPEIAYKRQKTYMSKKLKEMGERHVFSGDSIFVLEPNVKEGEGGLRDIHTAYWLAKVALKINSLSDFSGLLSAYDYRRFLSAYDFLLKTRCCLHLETNRKNDILTFDHQNSIATILGFKDSKKFRASERFMRYYYLKTKGVTELTHHIIDACSRPYVKTRKGILSKKLTDEFFISGKRLAITKENLFSENPDKIIECFYLYSKTRREFSEHLKGTLRSSILRITKKTRQSQNAIQYFIKILKSDRVYSTLREMHDIGILGRFIPEFGALRLLVIHEPYHVYTVDEHTLLAIRNLENLRTTQYKSLEHLREIIHELKYFDTLVLALLFHDIGKAAGRHHQEQGYKRLKSIMERFNLDDKKRMRIEFLVRNHILMAQIALKREIGDSEVLARFSDAVGDKENLKALYLITYADMSAVNPHFLSSWKAYLLTDLYERTLKYLSGIKEDKKEYIETIQNLAPEIDRKSLTHFIDEMPERYILSTTKEKVPEDYRLVDEMKKSGFAMRLDEQTEGVIEIVVSALDRPGLFSRIVGFLSSKGLNIVNGRIFTSKGDTVIDKIAVSNWNEIWWEGLVKDLKKGLKDIVVNEVPVHVVRRKRQAESIFDIFIELDNVASEEYSIIEIFSSDRLGLLYDISHVMHRRGINIVNARINTEDGLAQDVFYVQADRQKVNNIQAQELISDLWSILKE